MTKLDFLQRQHSYFFKVLVGGMALVIVSAVFGYYNHQYTYSAFMGIGGSLIVAALVTLFSSETEKVYRKFLGLGILDVHSSRDEIQPDYWVSWLGRAHKHCVLLGVAHRGWCLDPAFFPALEARLTGGVAVKMFFLDPTSQRATLRSREEQDRPASRTRQAGKTTVDDIRESIAAAWNFRMKLTPEVRSCLKLLVYDATPSCGMTWIDCKMVVTHYLGAFSNYKSPAFDIDEVPPDHPGNLYDTYRDNVEMLEKRCTIVLDDQNIGRYV